MKTRKPTGKPSWPLMLISGTEKSGKSYASAAASSSDLIDRTLWFSLGEDDPDELGALPGARFEIVEHDSTYRGLLAAITEAANLAPTDKPNLIVLDSGTRLWDMLCDEAQVTANRRLKAKDRPVPADGATISMDLWNVAKQRWAHVMDALRSNPGPSIITARLDEVTLMDGDKPTKDKEWRVKAEKSLPFDVGVCIEIHGYGNPYITGVRSLRFKPTPKELTPLPDDWSVDGLWRSLGLAEDVGERNHAPASGEASLTADEAVAAKRVELLTALREACPDADERNAIARDWHDTRGEQITETHDLSALAALVDEMTNKETKTA